MPDDLFDVDQYEGVDEALFKDIVKKDLPAVIKNCSFGDCMSKWTLDYLDDKLGQDDVIIHKSNQKELSFLDKNFIYETHKFHEFAQMIRAPHANYYYRSTSNKARSRQPASIEEDFPVIAKDLVPPKFIPYGKENALYHSSALRIASKNVQIWTHFDLYDNVLCQIVGTKRIVLIPPYHSSCLHPEGDKSPVDFSDPDLYERYPEMESAEHHRCVLEPGDCLFIPALWWHHIRSENVKSEMPIDHTIGFNIFWRNEKLANKSFYAQKDIYGNKNPLPYDAALKDFERAIQKLNKLPEKYSNFYRSMFLRHIHKEFDYEEYEDPHFE